ncbi:MAG: ATP-binding protein [Marinifilaceae bacterium]
MIKTFASIKALSTILLFLLISACNTEYSRKDVLTREERDWLNNQKEIRIAISTNFPPFQFTDENNTNKGLSVDFLELVEEKINYRFQRVYFENWKDILDAGKTRQVDAILEIQENPDRKRFFNFTHSFLEVPHAIIMRKDFTEKIDLSGMKGLKVAVVEDYAIHDFLKQNYPQIELLPLPDDNSCLRAVSLEIADAMVSSQGLAVYFIQKEAISNLHIVGHAEYKNILAIAVRKDWPILTRIIDKGLARISLSERNKIYDRWLQLTPINFWQQSQFWILIIALAIISILTISIISLWNQTLKRQVAVKTKQLQIAKDRAEESNRLKSSFLANMSHEIRTPLNAIQGFSELISQQELSPEKKEKYAGIIDTNCRSLIHLINEILDLSKIEAGQIVIRKQSFALLPFVEEIVQTHKTILKNIPGVLLTLKQQLPNRDFTIKADPIRLKQVLNNLLNNAEKFTHKGSIEIGLSLLNESELLFYVRDTGIGIAPEEQTIIFDRFTKIETNPSCLYRGSGLGLHICKKLLDLMGGKIWVESEPGKGSSFFFTLPKE